MSDNPNETDFDHLTKEAEDLLQAIRDASDPSKPSKGWLPIIQGNLWKEPGEEFKREGEGDLYATFYANRPGKLPYGVTLGMFVCPGCGNLHVNLFIDAKLVMEFKITPDTQLSMKPHFKWVKKHNQE